MDKLVEYRKANESDSTFFSFLEDFSHSDEFGFIKYPRDKEGNILTSGDFTKVSELRTPVYIDIHKQIRVINKFINDSGIIAHLKSLRHRYILYKNTPNDEVSLKYNVFTIDKDTIKTTKSKWILLYSIYIYLEQILKKYSKKIGDKVNKNIEFLSYLELVNNIALKKLYPISHGGADIDLESQSPSPYHYFKNKIPDDLDEKSKKQDYFNLLSYNTQFGKTTDEVNIGTIVKINDKIGLIVSKNSEGKYKIRYPDGNEEFKSPSEVEPIYGINNKISSIKNNNKYTIDPYEKYNEAIGDIDTVIYTYNILVNNYIKFLKMEGLRINYSKIYKTFYQIIFADLPIGFYLSSVKPTRVTEGKPETISKVKPSVIEVSINQKDPNLLSLCNEYGVIVEYEGKKYPSTNHVINSKRFPGSEDRFTIDGDLANTTILNRLFEGKDLSKRIKMISSKNLIGLIATLSISLYSKLGLEKPTSINKIELENIMLDINRIKFGNTQLNESLISTGDSYLLSYKKGSGKKLSYFDGEIQDGKLIGENKFGLILMKIREELGQVSIPQLGGASKKDILRFIDQKLYVSVGNTKSTKKMVEDALKNEKLTLDEIYRDNKWIVSINSEDRNKYDLVYYKNNNITLTAVGSVKIRIPDREIKIEGSSSTGVTQSDINPSNVLKFGFPSSLDIQSRPYIITYEIPTTDLVHKIKSTKLLEVSKKISIIDSNIYLNNKKVLDRGKIDIVDYKRDQLSNFFIENDSIKLFNDNDEKIIMFGYKKQGFNYTYKTNKYKFPINGLECDNINVGIVASSYLINNPSLFVEILNKKLNYIKPALNLDDTIETIFSPISDSFFTKIGVDKNIILEKYGNKSLYNLLLKRLLYAQFTENRELRDLLIETGEKVLIAKNPQGEGYYYLYSLMEIRYYINNNIDPDYFNSHYEKNQVNVEELKQDILKTLNTYDFKDENKLYEFIYSNIDTSTIQKDKLDELINTVVKSSEFINLRYKKINDEKHHIQIEEKDIEKLKQKVKLELDTHDTEMVGYGLSMSLPSNNFIRELQVLDRYLNILKMTYYDIPANGDCLFYSISDCLNYNDILPHKDCLKEIDGQFVLEKASKKIRDEIAQKLYKNKDNSFIKQSIITLVSKLGLKDIPDKSPESPKVLEKPTAEEQIQWAKNINVFDDESSSGDSSDEENSDTILSYCNFVKQSCSDDNIDNKTRSGIWGGDNEIEIVSALYNINIDCYSIYINENYDIKLKNINVRETSKKYPRGNTYNQDNNKTITIVRIVYGENIDRYISTRPLDSLLLYKYCKDDNIILRPEYDNFKNINIGKDFNTENGQFRLNFSDELQQGLDASGCTNVRYYSNKKDEVNYKGKIIGNTTDDIRGISFIE